MTRFAPRRLPTALLAALVAAGVAAALAWGLAFERALMQAEETGAARLAAAIERLESDLVRYKLLTKALAVSAPSGDRTALADRAAAISGARAIRFHSAGTPPPAADARAIARSDQGAMGFDYAGGAFLVAAPIREGRAVAGAVVAEIDAAELEWAWRASPEVLFFSGEAKIRVASLPALRGMTLGAETDLPAFQVREAAGRPTWRFGPDWRRLGVAFDEALVLDRPAPVVDMSAHMLIDLAPARLAASAASAAAGASVFALCLLALILLQRRFALRQRLALEARAKSNLEATVARRTAALTEEIAERRAAEARLRDAQDELVQAGKMSALGQMAAGLAHELNQPLTAIRGFADNARQFLDRGRADEADANLGRIGDLTDRAARIIKNLRAFARNAPEPSGPVDLTAVVEDAIQLSSARARVEGVELRFDRPPPVHVEGGVVRLQQVAVNLIANALDAQDAPAPIDVAIETDGDRARFTVRDRGPGLSAEAIDRVFEPFFTTKAASGEGMGLGLSISYGIVRSFGGDLRAANHPDGGAVFTVELKRAEPREAAA